MIYRRLLHIIYLILIFNYGIMRLLELPTELYKVLAPLILVLLFLNTFFFSKSKSFPMLIAFILFLIISFISANVNSIPIFNYIYFLTYAIFPIIYFYIIANENDKRTIILIKKTFIILIILQLPVIFIKFLILGYSESGAIGTLGTEAGSLSAIFPLFILIILYSYHLYSPRKKYIWLIIGYFLFGIIGGKRVLTIAFPVFLLTTLLIRYKKAKQFLSFKLFKKIIVYSLFGFILFYFSVRIHPTFNPENTFWGSFDLGFLTDQIFSYTTTGKKKDDIPRLEGVALFSSKLYNENITEFLIGEGAGKLIASKFGQNKTANLIEEYYGIFYGGRMGFVWIYMQVGILGLLLFIYFYLNLNIYNKIKQHPLSLAFSILQILFIFDFFYYSKVFITFPLLNNMYFFIGAIIYKSNMDKGYLHNFNKL